MKNLFLIFFFLIVFAACEDEKLKPEISHEIGGTEKPIQESWDSEILFSENGKLKAILFADHISMFENEDMTFIDGVKLDFYNEEEVKTSSLTSNKGKVDQKTQNMYAIGDVVAKSDSGVVLETDELMWRKKDGKIITDKFVTITSEKERIEGYGFESDQSLRNYTIYNITYSTELK